MNIYIDLLKLITPAVIAVILAELQLNRNYNKKKFNEQYAPYLHKHIFKKFLFTIEHQLYRKVTPKNRHELTKNINKLYSDITSNKKLFVLVNDQFLDSLYKLTKSNHKSLKTFQKNYNNFSKHYLTCLNQTRKAIGLKPRGDYYQKAYHLYKEKSFQWYSFKNDFKKGASAIALAMILTILLTILIASLINFVHATENLINQLTTLQQ